MATMMGRLLARLALGVPAAELGFPVTAERPVPLHALTGIAVRAERKVVDKVVDGLKFHS